MRFSIPPPGNFVGMERNSKSCHRQYIGAIFGIREQIHLNACFRPRYLSSRRTPCDTPVYRCQTHEASVVAIIRSVAGPFRSREKYRT